MRNCEEEKETGNPNLYGKEDRQSDRFDTIQLWYAPFPLLFFVSSRFSH